MLFLIRILISLLGFLLLQSCFDFASSCSNIPGKYFNVDERGIVQYVELKKDGTYFHYFKKDKKEFSHIGEWRERGNECVIEVDSWTIYDKNTLEMMGGFGGVKFGSSGGMMLFWPTKKYLRINPDGGLGFVKEKYVKEYLEDQRLDSIEWATKDTLFYDTGEVKEIGKLSNKRKYGIWKEYYMNGQLQAFGVRTNNKKKGIWKHYYESGELEAVGAYENDYKTGMWTLYYKNGKIKETGILMGGDKFNQWRLYNKEGKYIKTEKYQSRKKYLDSLFRIAYKMDTLYIEKSIKESIERMDSYYKEYEEELKKEKN